MPRPLRLFEPDGVYFVTGRCLQARVLMRPSAVTNRIIGGVLARAIRVFDVDVFAFIFVSNHFHLLLRSRDCRIPAFMQYLRSNIAKKVGQLVNWHGKFWDRRYDAEPVLDDDALVGRLGYILLHGVKEGLVARPQDWPGLTSIPELLAVGTRNFIWPSNKNVDSPGDLLRVEPLPCWSRDDLALRRRRLNQMMNNIVKETRKERGDRPVLGVGRVLAQDPYSRPRSIKRSPRPLCHASTETARKRYAKKYHEFASAFAEASAAYRGGTLDVLFPAYAHRPPWVVPHSLAA
jgi:REP element-mobilizing transposase RayT